MPELIQKKLENQRLALIKYIENRRPQGSLLNKVTIVFDGQSGVYGGEAESYIEIVFAKGISADDKIKQIVSDARVKKNIVVVTDDRGIQYAVRALSAQCMAVKEFLRDKKGDISGGSKKAAGSSTRPKRIPKNIEFAITDELKQVWLKKKKDKEKN